MFLSSSMPASVCLESEAEFVGRERGEVFGIDAVFSTEHQIVALVDTTVGHTEDEAGFPHGIPVAPLFRSCRLYAVADPERLSHE